MFDLTEDYPWLDRWTYVDGCWSIYTCERQRHILEIRSNLSLSVTDLILVQSIVSPGNVETVYMLLVLDNY